MTDDGGGRSTPFHQWSGAQPKAAALLLAYTAYADDVRTVLSFPRRSCDLQGIWGVLLQYLEGRRQTDLLFAAINSVVIFGQ